MNFFKAAIDFANTDPEDLARFAKIEDYTKKTPFQRCRTGVFDLNTETDLQTAQGVIQAVFDCLVNRREPPEALISDLNALSRGDHDDMFRRVPIVARMAADELLMWLNRHVNGPIRNRRHIGRCRNELCLNYFIVSDSLRSYCSKSCRNRRQTRQHTVAQRAYRSKHPAA